LRISVHNIDPAKAAFEETIAARLTQVVPAVSNDQATPSLSDRARGEDLVATQIGLRRALAVGCIVWSAFFLLDVAVVRYMQAGSLSLFIAVRIGGLAAIFFPMLRMRRGPVPSERTLRVADMIAYTSAAVGIAVMCVEFRGLASPYVPGCCLVLLARTVTAQDPWKRGVVMTGIPVISFFTVLFGSALFSPQIVAQANDPAALTTLAINSGYLIGTYGLLVMCGHIVWSLKRQVFEARSLGRYRLKRRLAAGGMGDVWVAYHPGLKRDVAVKILKPEERERSGSALARFEREVRATAELVHPNTVRVYDYGVTEDGLRYYVMELLKGETLAEHVSRLGPLPPSRAVHIVGQAARALGEAHERGIVHRDIKPENLFLTSLGGEHDFVKVIDFGIAKVQGQGSSEGRSSKVTETGWVLGTPAYMSPEVASGEPADARTDVYALGAVLYYLLCGRPPFEGENTVALIYAHLHERPSTPSRVLGRQLPPDVEAVVMRALEKEPGDRYATSAEFALALSACTMAGKWTFGDAVQVARQSSRPPPPSRRAGPGIVAARPPRVPNIAHSTPPGPGVATSKSTAS
jgi:serine/threonine-protein kinase